MPHEKLRFQLVGKYPIYAGKQALDLATQALRNLDSHVQAHFESCLARDIERAIGSVALRRFEQSVTRNVQHACAGDLGRQQQSRVQLGIGPPIAKHGALAVGRHSDKHGPRHALGIVLDLTAVHAGLEQFHDGLGRQRVPAHPGDETDLHAAAGKHQSGVGGRSTAVQSSLARDATSAGLGIVRNVGNKIYVNVA